MFTLKSLLQRTRVRGIDGVCGGVLRETLKKGRDRNPETGEGNAFTEGPPTVSDFLVSHCATGVTRAVKKWEMKENLPRRHGDLAGRIWERLERKLTGSLGDWCTLAGEEGKIEGTACAQV